jgi:hypothetical protein
VLTGRLRNLLGASPIPRAAAPIRLIEHIIAIHLVAKAIESAVGFGLRFRAQGLLQLLLNRTRRSSYHDANVIG